MKNRAIKITAVLLAAVAAGSAVDLSAKDKVPFWQGSDIRISWGAGPLDFLDSNMPWDMNYTDASLGGYILRNSVYYDYGMRTGAFNFTYSYRFRRWFELSGVFTYSGYVRPHYDIVTTERKYTEHSYRLSLMPYVRFVWLYREMVRLYSGIGIGVSYVVNDTKGRYDDAYASVCGSLTPFGIAVGRDFYGFGEFSIGTSGVIQIGIGYRF